MVKHKDAIKVRYYKSKACLLANNCCSKCEAMYEYGDGKYCCFDNVMRFIEYVNKYKIEILRGRNMIYTSYFAKLKSLPEHIIPISICGKAPDWYKGLQYKKLAPKYDFFMKWKENHDNDYYIKCFNEQVLDKLDWFQVYEELHNLADSCGKSQYEIALICYEKPSDFCHRHLVSDWLNKNLILCEEWQSK